MAQTTVKVPKGLFHRIKDKNRESRTIHPGFVVSLALELWATDKWTPGPDVEELKDESLFLELADNAYRLSLAKRMETNTQISPIIRRALLDWVDGKWKVSLVSNHES
jgi:hypothetical protein